MTISSNFLRILALYSISGTFFSLILLGNSAVLAHGGHGNEFQVYAFSY